MGTSTTIPPSGTTSDPVPSLYLSDTFYTWFNTTNDLINKVNPIEVYTIKSITGGHEVTFQKGGVNQLEGLTLDDLGNGNWQFGYVLPKDITGGHTWHQAHQFINGISGHIANSFNGRTGEIVGVNSISARLPVVSGGTGNVESAVFTVNLVSAATHGAMTLEAGDIPGSLAFATGPMGYILGASFGADGVTGVINYPVALFENSGAPDATQDALSIRGKAAGGTGNEPRVTVGKANTYKNDAMLFVDANHTSSQTAGAIATLVNSTYGWDLKGAGKMGIAASAGMWLDVSNAAVTGGFIVQKSNVAGEIMEGNVTKLFEVENDATTSLIGPIKDSDGNTAGTVPSQGNSAGYFLVSDANSKMVWKNAPEGAWDYSTDSSNYGGGQSNQYHLLNNVPDHIKGSTDSHMLTIYYYRPSGIKGQGSTRVYSTFEVTKNTSNNRISNTTQLRGDSYNSNGTILNVVFGTTSMLVSPAGHNGNFYVHMEVGSAAKGSNAGNLLYYIWS